MKVKVTLSVPKKIDISIFDKQKVDIATRIATSTVYALQTKRIFGLNGGKQSDGTNFPRYSFDYMKYVRMNKKGRTNLYINFILTGEMSNEYIWGVNRNGKYSFGYQQKPNGDKKSPNASQKAEYQEERFKDLFALSKAEKKAFNDILIKNLNK